MLGLHQLYFLDTRSVVAHFSGVACLFCGASYFVFDHSKPLRNIEEGHVLLMLLGVGVMATIGQLCLTKAFTTGAPAKVSVVGLTQIVFAMLYDVVQWQQSFEASKLFGMLLIIAPTAWLLTRRASEEGKEEAKAAPEVATPIPENPP
jgi:drug/metabolite transporter (DMT)-like permease